MTLTDREIDAMLDRLNRGARRLMELGCDSVRIVATAPGPRPGETAHLTTGYGNWYAQVGAVRGWLDGETGTELAGDGEGEEWRDG